MNLPDDLRLFLESGRRFEFDSRTCEVGWVHLHPLSDLKIQTFHLQTYGTPFEREDPHKDEDGFYLVPAVSLVAECQNYLPEFLLLWLPGEGLFGTGDEEH